MNVLPYKNYDLKKHVAAIHSANKLSLVQRKIANALLFNAYSELATKQEHQIHIRTLSTLIGYNSNELNAIKKALVSLISTVVEWNLIDKERVDNAGVWNASAIIADASIDGAVCTYSYSNKMRQLLFHPEMYGRLNMQVQARFKSSYGLVLYENCARYQNIQETPWFDMPVFRKLMGVEDEKYPVFKDFRKRVIDAAVKEVNEYSGMDINYLLKKVGRIPVAIKFHITATQQKKEVALVPITQNKPRAEDTLTKRSDYEKYRQQAIMIHFSQLSEKEQNGVLVNFSHHIKNTIYETLFVRDQLQNAIVLRKFTQFLKEQSCSHT